MCEFPSKEFYEGRLKSDYSVRFRSFDVRNFWPRGKQSPFVFCDVEGQEETAKAGVKETTRVGMASKFNKREAMKVVSGGTLKSIIT